MILQIYNPTTSTWVDITPYIAYKGVKYTRNDVDGSGAGRDITGNLIRDRVGIKDKLEISCKPMLAAECALILSLIEPEWLTVKFYSPRTGAVETETMYSNNTPASYLMNKNGTEYWDGISFPLVQK